MGCYGIGVNRIVAGICETRHDENGLIWPLAIAPYSVLLIPLNMDDDQVLSTAQNFYDELTAAGVDVLFDDRKQRPGFKFKDADLIGVPLRIVVGARGLKDGNVEVKWRTESDPTHVAVAELVPHVLDALAAKRAEEESAAPD